MQREMKDLMQCQEIHRHNNKAQNISLREP